MKASNNSVFWKEFVENGRLGSTFIIDCHTHMGDIAGASEPIYTVDECVDLMAQENIDSIWCAPHSDIFGVEKQVRSAFQRSLCPAHFLKDRRVPPLDKVSAHQAYDGSLRIPCPDQIQLPFMPQMQGIVFTDNTGDIQNIPSNAKIFLSGACVIYKNIIQ